MIEDLSLEQVIDTLNAIGPVYHSGLGIHPTNTNNGTCELVTTDDHIADWYQMYCDSTEDFDEEAFPCAEFTLDIDIEALNNHLRHVVPYKSIIIKYQSKQWEKLPDFWYNRKSTWWARASPEIRKYTLPFLNSRSYITVFQSFMEVHLSAEQKGSMLTIDDILFATRALLIDDCRVIDGGYKLISVSGNDTLIIEPISDSG